MYIHTYTHTHTYMCIDMGYMYTHNCVFTHNARITKIM